METTTSKLCKDGCKHSNLTTNSWLRCGKSSIVIMADGLIVVSEDVLAFLHVLRQEIDGHVVSCTKITMRPKDKGGHVTAPTTSTAKTMDVRMDVRIGVRMDRC